MELALIKDGKVKINQKNLEEAKKILSSWHITKVTEGDAETIWGGE